MSLETDTQNEAEVAGLFAPSESDLHGTQNQDGGDPPNPDPQQAPPQQPVLQPPAQEPTQPPPAEPIQPPTEPAPGAPPPSPIPPQDAQQDPWKIVEEMRRNYNDLAAKFTSLSGPTQPGLPAQPQQATPPPAEQSAQPAPPAQPPPEPVRYIKDDAEFEAVLNDPDKMNALLHRIKTEAKEEAKREAVTDAVLVTEMRNGQRNYLAEKDRQFYERNSDLAEYKAMNAFAVEQIFTENPDKGMASDDLDWVMEKAAERVRKTLNLPTPQSGKVIAMGTGPAMAPGTGAGQSPRSMTDEEKEIQGLFSFTG